jgi:hypothetical protein
MARELLADHASDIILIIHDVADSDGLTAI